MAFAEPAEWTGPSDDPNDHQVGDLVEAIALDEAEDYDVVLVGEPYDGAVIGRRGAAAAPAAIRETLAGVYTAGISTQVGDLGDVTGPGFDAATGVSKPPVSEVQTHLQSITEGIHATDALPVFLGGDNSLTVANAGPLLADGPLGIISFDAHLDCREVRDGPTSGTPYRQLHDRGLAQQVVVGARAVETSPTYHEYLSAQDGTVLDAAHVGRNPATAIETIRETLDRCETVYVSIDMDVLDAAHAPGVSAPTPGGLTTRELYEMIAHVVGIDHVAGIEIVECAPPLDTDGRTVAAAARAIAHVLREVGG